MSTNLEYREGERQRKRESRRQAGEAQRVKGRQRSRARDKKQRRHFFVGRITWKFCSGGDKMGNASSGHQWKVKISGSEKIVNENTYDSSSIKRVTKKFLEVSRCSLPKQRQRNVQKKCVARANLLFCWLDLFLFFTILVAFAAQHIYILFEQTKNIIESFSFSPG